MSILDVEFWVVVLHPEHFVCSIGQGGDGEHEYPNEKKYPDCLHKAGVCGWCLIEDHLAQEVDCVGDGVIGVEPGEKYWLCFWRVEASGGN